MDTGFIPVYRAGFMKECPIFFILANDPMEHTRCSPGWGMTGPPSVSRPAAECVSYQRIRPSCCKLHKSVLIRQDLSDVICQFSSSFFGLQRGLGHCKWANTDLLLKDIPSS